MISCDQCGGWFHGNCVNITEEAGKLMEKDHVPFVCPECKIPGMLAPYICMTVTNLSKK
jgi:hypothetical protein